MILGSNVMADDSGAGRLRDFCSVDGVSHLLALTTDAVVCIGSDGRIVVANEQFATMCGLSRIQILGMDVTTLLLTTEGLPATDLLSIDTDTYTRTLLLRQPTMGDALPVFVRVARLAETASRIIVLTPTRMRERTDVTQELEDFLSSDLAERGNTQAADLIDDAMGEMRDVVGADGALLYVYDKDGYRLRARTDNFDDLLAPAFLPHTAFVTTLMAKGGGAKALEPSDKDLFGPGNAGEAPVTDAVTGEVYELRRGLVPHLAFMYAVPIRYETMIVGLMVVGWTERIDVCPNNCRVLDALAKHLGSEIVTALSAISAQRVENLQDAASAMREQIAEGAAPAKEVTVAFKNLAATLECEYLPVFVNEHQNVTLLELPEGEHLEFPFDVDALVEGRHSDGVAVVPLRIGGDIALWLAQRDLPSRGALVDAGVIGDSRKIFLVVRGQDKEPLQDVDCTLLSHFVQDVRGVAGDEQVRERSAFIAQSLQSGMSNHVQKVDGITCAHTYNSATETASVGGDFYDLIRLPDRRACIILGDVAGKGVQSASVSAAVRTALGAYAWEGLMPAHMVRSLNDFFMGFSRLETFATLFVGIVDLKSASLTYCSAGHPPAILVRAQQKTVETLNVQSGVVGAFREMAYHDGRVSLEKGDTLLLYTDGVTEARAPGGAFFGESGLRDTVVRWMSGSDKDLPEFVLDRLYEFTDSTMDDDVAMMAVRFDKLGAAARVRKKGTSKK